MTKKKLLIIDAHALIHRAFHALPPLTTRSGEPMNAAYGFLLILIRAIKDIKPHYVAVAFDSKEKTFRHKQYEQYKANRVATPAELISQFPIVRNLVEAFGFPAYSVAGYEADDIIGTICKQFDEQNDIETIIVTGDLDMLQLVDHNTKVLKLQKGVKETLLYDEALVKEKHGLTPKQIVDYKALRGDSSDNIPGVKGIGEKGATTLLQQYTSVENIYTHLDEIEGRCHKALMGHKKDAFLSKALATIVQDAPIQFSFTQAAIGQYHHDELMNLFRQYEFRSLLPQLNSLPEFNPQKTLFSAKQKTLLPNNIKETEQSTASYTPYSPKSSKEKFNYQLIQSEKEIQQFAAKLSEQQLFAFDTETTGLNPISDELVGMSFSWKEGEAYYVSCGKTIPTALARIFENAHIQKTGHNTKFDVEVLHHAGIHIAGMVFDSMLASYLLNAGSRAHGLDNLVFIEFGHHMQPIEELIGKGKTQITMRDVPVEKVSWYACEDANFALRLYKKYAPIIQQQGLQKLLTDIEMPTIDVLVAMEENGIKIDVPFLRNMSKTLHKRLNILEQDIQKMAGVNFNVASNVQLKEVLFKKMNLPTAKLKKTKTGFSTAASELEKLQGEHPIIDLVSEHRELSKLTSTYIDALPELINPHTGRIHTSFNQTITATGRLSSSEPNLQNIPIRTTLGNEIRKAFIPGEGKNILALDYSQIELRIVAHLAGDTVMTQAFKKDEDIHARTAAELNDVSLEKVTPEMRRAAKAINFGILYGMGVQGVVRDSGMSREEARIFLDKYFSIHTGIHQYIEQIKTKVQQLGYAETLFGRRRILPEIHSSNQMVRAAAERAAVNMPVQGTAADIMKLAMIAVHQAIKKNTIQAKVILQVHDELVFEVDKKSIKTEARKIQKIMENIYKLSVPLTVSVKYGENWGELKYIE
ncbi:MAG TPA: DNA polymerase I [Patescibacteria group bacterium]|nr:DNA polymerase I [Patescibacteria group bacterium]